MATQISTNELWKLLTAQVGMDTETAEMYMDDLTEGVERHAFHPGDGSTVLVFARDGVSFQETLTDVVSLAGGEIPLDRAESETFGTLYLAGGQVASVFDTQRQAQRYADSLLDAMYDAMYDAAYGTIESLR